MRDRLSATSLRLLLSFFFAPLVASCVTVPVQPMPAYTAHFYEVMEQELPDRCSVQRLTSNFAPSLVRLAYNTYPTSALAVGIQGWVAVEYRVEPDGSFSQARVLESSPAGIFERAAENVLYQMHLPAAAEPCYKRSVIVFAIAE